jgi:crotonobetainyl-CoA:carnitine CoA-transferase CaiB-like acyl-CoA transferase
MMAGPFSTMILAEQGADVVKIEPLGGDMLRHLGTTFRGTGAMFLNTNRNKRSIALNLKDPRCVEVVHRLVGQSDVFLENFRADVADRLGLGYEQLSGLNPGLIYARVAGMGAKGPAATRRVYDPMVQAHAGVCSIQGGSGKPDFMRTLIADKVAPTLMAQAITAALYERTQSGRGQRIEISMLQGAFWWMWADMMTGLTYDQEGLELHPLYVKKNIMWETKDGYLVLTCNSDIEWQAICSAFRRHDLAADPRFASIAGRREHLKEMEAEIAAELVEWPTGEALDRLVAADAAVGPINTPEALLDDPQILANDMYTVFEDEELGKVRQPTPPVIFDRTPSSAALAPKLGEHTDTILAELGYSVGEREGLKADGVVR